MEYSQRASLENQRGSSRRPAADPRADDARELGDGESLSHVPGRASEDGNTARRKWELAGTCAPKTQRSGKARGCRVREW